MEPTQKLITVVYSVALLSLVVMAAFVLLILFGHRGHKAAASLPAPLTVAAKYEAHLRAVHASHRSIMPLSTVGYTASGAGTGAANGNYVPVVGAYATYGGVTQYTNGTYFLSYTSGNWRIETAANNTGTSLYSSGANDGTSMATFWSPIAGTAPAPTFAAMAAVPLVSSADTLLTDSFTVTGVSRFGGVFSDLIFSDTLTVGPRNGALQSFKDSLLGDTYSPQGVGLTGVSFSDSIFSDTAAHTPTSFSPRLFADTLFADTGGRTGSPSHTGGTSPPVLFADTLFTDSLTRGPRNGGGRLFADSLFTDSITRGVMNRAAVVFSDTLLSDTLAPVQLSPAINPVLVDSRDPFVVLRTELQYLITLKGNSAALLATTLAVLDKLAASYRINELNQMANTLAGLPVLIRGGDGTTVTTYGYGADVPILALLPASASLQLAAVPSTILGNAYKVLMSALATNASKLGYLSLDAYLTAQNGTAYSALVHPNFAAINALYFNGKGSLLLSPGNVFAPQTAFGSATVGASAGTVTYTDTASIPAANVISATAYTSTQGYVPSKGVSLTVTTAINGPLTITLTGNGASASGAIVTGRTWTGTLSSLSAGSTVSLAPTVAGDRISRISGIVGVGAATVGAFAVNSVIERAVS